MAIGVGIVTRQAADAGIGSVPVPITDASWDGWMYHRFFDLFDTAGVAAEGEAKIQFEVDTKAMRKIHENEALVAVAESAISGGTPGSSGIIFDSRILFLLP